MLSGDFNPSGAVLFGDSLNHVNRAFCRFILLLADALVDFFSMNRDLARRLNAQPDLIPLDAQYRDINVITDDHGFSDPSRKYQHLTCPPAFCD